MIEHPLLPSVPSYLPSPLAVIPPLAVILNGVKDRVVLRASSSFESLHYEVTHQQAKLNRGVSLFSVILSEVEGSGRRGRVYS
jgi:hypothetical protein